MIQHTFTKNVSHVKLSTIELYAFTLKHMQHFLRPIQAANGIHGFQIHSSSYTCVCVSSQVCIKLQMMYTEALRSLTHTPHLRLPLIV